MIEPAFVADLLSEWKMKVGEGPCHSPHASVDLYDLGLLLPIFPSEAPLHANALSLGRVALEESYPTRCVSAVSDLFPVDQHHFPSHGLRAGHHHGLIGLCSAVHRHDDEGTAQVTEAQEQDAQAPLEDLAEHLLAVSVEALLSSEE